MVVEFLFDYASPYSFLASEMLATRLPGVTIRYVPTYLRGFESFAPAVPFTAAKLAYTITDLRRCAAVLGLELRIPPTFPVNGLFALRAAIAADRAGVFGAYHAAIFRAAWLDGRDISTKPAFTTVATELGFADLATAIDDPAIKDALRANTDAAIARGAFGLPTFFVGRELFWGHDRLDHVVREVERASRERRRRGATNKPSSESPSTRPAPPPLVEHPPLVAFGPPPPPPLPASGPPLLPPPASGVAPLLESVMSAHW